MNEAPIHIWPWDSAPEQYKGLSTNGGDEDWVARIPAWMREPSFMDEGSLFGCCSVDRFELMDGYSILIGSHA